MPEQPPKGERYEGVSPDGQPVNNVTADNRYDINPNSPNLLIHLMTEDLARVLAIVYIPHTREMPDVVMLGNKPFTVYDTTLNPPQYMECMVARATWEPEKDTGHGTT